MTSLPALLLFLASAAVAVWSFRRIIRRYETPSAGFPWLLSVILAAAALAAIFALHGLVDASLYLEEKN